MKIWRLLIVLLPVSILAQKNSFQDITIADGLSQGMVFSMLQDKNGFVWVATKNGLNRFDGYNYKTFFANTSQPYSISENQVTALYEDMLGRLWIGTRSKGLNLYDSRTQRFYHASVSTPEAAGKRNLNPPISSITGDSLGRIWIGTFDGKIARLQIKPAWPGSYPSASDFTKDIQIKDLASPANEAGMGGLYYYPTKKNGLLAIIGNGLYKINSHDSVEILLKSPAANIKTLRLLETADGALIVTQTNQVLQWTKPGTIKTLFSHTANPLPFGMYIDALGNVWGILNNKIFRQHYSQLDQHFFEQPPAGTTMKSGYFTCNLIDNQQHIWWATNGFGIKKWAVRQYPFRHVLAGNSIWHVFKDRQGRIFAWDFVWAYQLDSSTGQASTVPLLPQYSTQAKGKMLQDKSGDFWWVIKKSPSDHHMLLVHLDSNLHTKKEYELHQEATFQYTPIIQDRNGLIWIACRSSRIIMFNPQNAQQQVFDYSLQIRPNTDTEGVINMYEDAGGQLWICTKNGLLKALWQNGRLNFALYKNNPTDAQSLPNDLVTGVVDDPYEPHKWLWIATHGGGLARMDKTTGKMRQFAAREGLPSNNVVGILADNAHRIWISTYRGISQIDPKSFVLRHFSERDGLQSDEFNTGVFCKSATGELLFGGINGLNIFNPADLPEQSEPPATVKIVGLKLNNEPVLPGDSSGIIAQSIEYLPPLNLSHSQNQLTFEFSTLDLHNAGKNRYRYQLAGIDKDWVQGGTNRFANYAQLPPGRYTLRVAASTDGLAWTHTPTELQIIIHPPWYGSWWAYLAYAIIIAALIRWAYQAQVRRLKLQTQLAFESKEAGRLAELDQIKTQFFNNISHEFRTPLTLLIGPIEELKQQRPSSLLDTMERNARRLLSLINQLLDLGKLDAAQMKVDLQQGDLVEFIGLLASSFDTVAAKNRIVFEKKIAPATLPAHFDADKIEKIVTNLLSNAFKFTGHGGTIQLKVAYDSTQQSCSIMVSDTGVGIPPDKLEKVFDRFYQIDASSKRNYEGTGIGLSLVKELVSLLQGCIRAESKPGVGTRFWVNLPIAIADKIIEPQAKEFGQTKLNGETIIDISHNGTAIAGSTPSETPHENVLLIVEDNDDLRAYIRSVFAHNYRVIEAKDGQEGYEKAMESIPDIIISDLMMPRMDGFEFCQLVKTTDKTSHIPVVMLTAKSSTESRLEGLELGADDYLVKPFVAAEIKARVANLIKIREQLRQKFAAVLQASQPSGEPKLPSMDEAFMAKANAVIAQFLSQNSFDVEQFAQEMNMTPLQLRRKLKAITNYSTVEYLRRQRLQKAASLLAQKTATVKEIAYEVGFENMSYFSKMFQEEYGVVPSEYVGETV